MSKVQSSLLEKVNQSPEKKYSVLIVIEENAEPSGMKLANFSRPMSNILSATVAGKKILQLAKMKEVLSIEEDVIMGTM